MSLEEAYKALQYAQEILKKHVEAEQQKKAGKVCYYCFVYEQQYTDAPGEWGPNYQIVEASSIENAFCVFGHCVQTMGLTVRNVCYGLHDEMESERDRITDFYRKRREQHKEKAGKTP